MNYPFARADWFIDCLPSTNLYRRVKASFLTLGHLRTAEALANGILHGCDATLMDYGLLITISQYDWRVARKKASKPSLWWALKRDYNTPKNVQELERAIGWLKEQNYHPSRLYINQNERVASESAKGFDVNRASSTIERLAMSVTAVSGWQTLLNVECVWDAPMVAVTHLLIANAEIAGAYHIPYDLIKEALSNG